MTEDLKKAAEELKAGGYTCVLRRGDGIYTSTDRGVKPLLQWLAAGTDLTGFSAADKVVGKAPAMLYALLGVSAVYAPIMSAAAVRVLKEHGIEPYFDKEVEVIKNRAFTANCPMEDATAAIEDPAQALAAIKARLRELAAGK